MAVGIAALVLLMAGGARITVCPSGCAYSSIQAVVNVAAVGDTILVYSDE